MDNQEGHVAGNPPQKRRRYSISVSETSLSNSEDPVCQVCLNLDWDCYSEYKGADSPYEREHFVSFCQIIFQAKNGCPSCTVLNNAIMEFSKPLLKLDVDFVGKLLLSEIAIQLQRGRSTIVEVMEEDKEDLGEPYFSIEIYKSQDEIESEPVLGAAKTIQPLLDIDNLKKFVESKRQVCELEHQHWSTEEPSLPSRVLFISKESSVYKIKLIESLGLTGSYIALSHCWGQDNSPLETTRKTLSSYLEEIQFPLLPKTFQDAVRITESLGISYLWIDSLCIIQHDEEDWKVETSKMEDVYSNAFITLAATGSSSSHGGCLFSRKHITDHGISIPHKDSKFHSDRALVPGGVNIRYKLGSHTDVMEQYLLAKFGGAPLLNRAWVLQERLLSPVFLHFHKEELVWECQESTSCECGFLEWEAVSYDNLQQRGEISIKADFIRLSKTLGHPEAQQETYNFWLKAIEYFTSLSITKDSDRLPAVTGIARRLCKSIPGCYLLGIWSSDLARGLLWQIAPYQQSVRVTVPSGCHLPTWSWASVNIVSTNYYGLSYSEISSPFQIDSRFNIQRSGLGQNIFVPGQRCSLLLSGAFIFCTLKCERPAENFIPSHVLNFQDQEEYMYIDVSCDLNTVGQSCRSRKVCCLLVGGPSELGKLVWTKSERIETRVYWSLVLQQLASGDYERIGVAAHDSKQGWFEKAEVKQITLI